MSARPISGTQKGDVYSFAIVLQELMFRAEPYFLYLESPQGMQLIVPTQGSDGYTSSVYERDRPVNAQKVYQTVFDLSGGLGGLTPTG